MSNGFTVTIDRLLAVTAVTDVTGTRIKPFPLPKNTALPAIAIEREGEDEEMTLSGPGQYYTTTLRLHCIANTAQAADQLGDHVRTALHGQQATIDSLSCSWWKQTLDTSDYDKSTEIHRRLVNYDCQWR